MLNLPSNMSIFVHSAAVDLRKGFDGLSGIVRRELGADPLDGSLFVFFNRRRDRVKMLHFDGSGYWLYYKLLEAGTFEALTSDEACVTLDATQLAMLLSGVPLRVTQHRRKRYQRPLDGSKK